MKLALENVLEGQSPNDIIRNQDDEAMSSLVCAIYDDFTDLASNSRYRIAEALAGQSILLVDSSMGQFMELLTDPVNDFVAKDQGSPLGRFISREVFDGTHPTTNKTVFAQFLGSDVAIRDLIIGSTLETHSAQDVGAVFWSGSPAMITDFESDSLARSRLGSMVTRELADRAHGIYRDSLDAGKPQVGFCFGHQLFALEAGNAVRRMEHPFEGFFPIKRAHLAAGHMDNVLGVDTSEITALFTSHSEVVVPTHGARSLSFLELAGRDADNPVSYGMLSGRNLTAPDEHARYEQVRNQIHEPGTMQLSCQAHPEMTIPLLIHFLASSFRSAMEVSDLPIEDIVRSTAECLKVIASFLEKQVKRPVST